MMVVSRMFFFFSYTDEGNDEEILPVPPDDKHQTDMITFCIFSDCFVKYVHIVLVQAWRETNSAE